MSLIFMFFYWVIFPGGIIFLTWLLFTKSRKRINKVGIVFLGVLLFSFYIWITVGDIWLADQKVKKLCHSDGGIKIYQTDSISKVFVDKYGIIRIPNKLKYSQSDRYYYDSSISYISKESPKVWKMHYTIYRNSDNKLLGESVVYGRRGGGVLGPWHESSFSCPDNADIADLKKAIFVKD